MSGRRLLVTGGAGFIGSNFVHDVLQQHPEDAVTVFDKLTYAGNRENLRDLERDPRYRFVQGDIADPAIVEPLFREQPYDAVVNFAAETHVDRSIVDPTTFLTTNVIGTQVLLNAACRAPRRPAMFLQISTDEVYGSTTVDRPFTEESPIRPNSPYAASKAGADLLARAFQATFGLPVVITRSSNNFGPYQYPEKFIPLAITHALDNEPIPLYGDGLNVRDWIYVEDNCRAIDQVLCRVRPAGREQVETFNIGAGQGMPNKVVLETLLDLLGKPHSLIQPVPDRPGHDRGYVLTTDKLRRAIGWAPAHNFQQGLQKTIAWYQAHREWWEPLKRRAAVHWLPAAKGA